MEVAEKSSWDLANKGKIFDLENRRKGSQTLILYLNTVFDVTYSMDTANSCCIQHSTERELEKLFVTYDHVLCTEQVHLQSILLKLPKL